MLIGDSLPPPAAGRFYGTVDAECESLGLASSNPHVHRQRRAAISKEEPIELDGEIVDVLGNSNFRVQVSENHNVLAKIAGRMRRHRIRIFEGDRVKVEVSPYDLNRGRIVWRYS